MLSISFVFGNLGYVRRFNVKIHVSRNFIRKEYMYVYYIYSSMYVVCMQVCLNTFLNKFINTFIKKQACFASLACAVRLAGTAHPQSRPASG